MTLRNLRARNDDDDDCVKLMLKIFELRFHYLTV